MYYAAWGAHAVEATFALKHCNTLGIAVPQTTLWVLQTFLLGFPSLQKLQNAVKNEEGESDKTK